MNTLIDRIEQAMKFNTQDRNHQSQLLEHLYRTVDERSKMLLDEAFVCITGSRLEALVE